jgi:type II secretory pathway component PulK
MQEQECARPRPAADDSGVALLVALAVVAILAVAVLDFTFSVRVNTHVAMNFRDRLVALEAAKAGVYYGIYMLRQDDPGQDNLQDEWAQAAGIVLDQTNPLELSEQAGWTEDDLKLDKHEDFVAQQDGGNVPTASIIICDEERKLNVNLLAGQGANPFSKEWIRTLVENIEFPDVDAYELVDNIVDWIDDDDNGDAEYSYYENLPVPYSCRNDQMESIYELKMVKGMTDLVFFGNMPYPMQLTGGEEDQWEEREQLGYTLPELAPWERDEDPEAIYGLVNFLTAQSSGRINFLTAPPEVLRAIFANDDTITEEVIEARQLDPMQSSQILQVIRQLSPALSQNLRGVIGAQSSTFRIESTGKFHKAAVKVTAVVSRSTARDITILYWRKEDVRPESLSEDVPWVNVL